MCILKKQKTWDLCSIWGHILSIQFHCKGYSNTWGLYVGSLTLKNQLCFKTVTASSNIICSISTNISEKILDWFVYKKKKRCVFHQYFKIQLKIILTSSVILKHYIPVLWTTVLGRNSADPHSVYIPGSLGLWILLWWTEAARTPKLWV